MGLRFDPSYFGRHRRETSRHFFGSHRRWCCCRELTVIDPGGEGKAISSATTVGGEPSLLHEREFDGRDEPLVYA